MRFQQGTLGTKSVYVQVEYLRAKKEPGCGLNGGQNSKTMQISYRILADFQNCGQAVQGKETRLEQN